MRAVVQTAIGGPEVLQAVSMTPPEPRRSSMLVRVGAVGVNFHDVEIRRRGEAGVDLPYVLGTDIVGRVESTAPDVTAFVPGQRVLSLVRSGGYAEVVRVHAAMSFEVPDEIDDATAAAIPVPGLTAWFLCRDHVTTATRHVVVHAAAGGVGCWVPSLLRGTGVRTVGIVSTPAKADIAAASGYDRVVVRTGSTNVVEAVLDATGRRGGDLVLDPVGGPAFADSFRMARHHGTVVLFGRAAGPPSLAGLAEVFLDARRNLQLSTFFLSRTLLSRMAELGEGFATLMALARAGTVRMPTLSLPLAEAAHAHRLLESRGTVGKIVLVP